MRHHYVGHSLHLSLTLHLASHFSQIFAFLVYDNTASTLLSARGCWRSPRPRPLYHKTKNMLTSKQVDDIKTKYEQGYSEQSIAAEYLVSRQTINNICKGRFHRQNDGYMEILRRELRRAIAIVFNNHKELGA